MYLIMHCKYFWCLQFPALFCQKLTLSKHFGSNVYAKYLFLCRHNICTLFLCKKILISYILYWTVDCGLWTVDCGLWTVDRGLLTVDCGLWTMGSRPWTKDSGPWTVDRGPWTVDRGPRTQDSRPRKEDPGHRTEDHSSRLQLRTDN